ncbi:MAG: hypothetical protein IJA64_07045 [Rikenellaceae bacterium]|nr:hypothetical protein [Rikenellaceae bacterium]
MKKFVILLLFVIGCFANYINAQSLTPEQNKIAERIRNNAKRDRSYPRDAYTAHVAWIKYQNFHRGNILTSENIEYDETSNCAIIRWKDGAVYKGHTYYGEMKGVGTMVYPDGSKYCGTWERDLPNGKGTFQTPEGITFTVNFENGLPHGKGVIQDLDGRMYSARWVRGVLKEKSIKPYKEKK